MQRRQFTPALATLFLARASCLALLAEATGAFALDESEAASGALERAASMLRAIGQGRRVDDLVNSMNRAAERAVPEARPLLVHAVKSMSVDDAVKIVRGGDTSVTDFFAGKTRVPLGEKFLPIVTAETQKVSLTAKYNAVASKGSAFGLVKPEDANVEQYVTRKALDGLYFMIGQEEKKIRADPVATGSAILKAVFGGH